MTTKHVRRNGASRNGASRDRASRNGTSRVRASIIALLILSVGGHAAWRFRRKPEPASPTREAFRANNSLAWDRMNLEERFDPPLVVNLSPEALRDPPSGSHQDQKRAGRRTRPTPVPLLDLDAAQLDEPQPKRPVRALSRDGNDADSVSRTAEPAHQSRRETLRPLHEDNPALPHLPDHYAGLNANDATPALPSLKSARDAPRPIPDPATDWSSFSHWMSQAESATGAPAASESAENGRPVERENGGPSESQNRKTSAANSTQVHEPIRPPDYSTF